MKTVILFLLLCPLLSYCQKKQMQIDKLTGDTGYYVSTFLLTGRPTIIPKPYVDVTIVKGKSFGMSVTGMCYQSISTLPQGDSISFKFKSGAFYSIPYLQTTFAEYSSMGGMYYYKQTLLIDQDILDSLIKDQVVFVRVGGSNAVVDYNVTEKGAKSFHDALLLFKEDD